ncbi:uncharacterized protein LOC143543162 [Bidens hawaiensis]|uniref:uncharacterized protein LOC143543162 n=1 Tax=Bidens hawaiensis TaxID=980011 RepID=UPI004049E795
MDPLTALREMTIRNDLDKIVRVGDHYRFGPSLSFPCTIDTAYRSKQGNRYTLETLVYFITNLTTKHHDYIRNAGIVSFLGFYMRFEDDSVESAKIVKQWNVKIISISKNKRHQDRAAALDVWDRLEEFVRSWSRS